MFRRLLFLFSTLLFLTSFSGALFAQQAAAPPAPSAPAGQHCVGCEFPIVMMQNVVAGKTAVGSKVRARLVVATMLKGGVIPRDAVMTGEVTESVAKSASEPSRLAIRMDSAQWKNGGARFKVYLTAWFYPQAAMAPQDLSYQPADAPGRNKNPGGTDYTDPKNPMSQQKWPPQQGDNSMQTDAPASVISTHRVLMKNLESKRNDDGSVVLVSEKSNIKLDKNTTYVLAAGDLIGIQ
jgi:hypothetical protein